MSETLSNQDAAREYFDETYKDFFRGEFDITNDDGTISNLRAYELMITQTSETERKSVLIEFVLRAKLAGYEEAASPLVLPNSAYQMAGLPLTAVQFFFKRNK